MNQKSHQETLPKKRMAAGCLFRNSSHQILIVQPTYKPNWETPGGVTEDNESPRACAAREVHEELNLEVEVGRLLVVDYTSENEEFTEALMWVFDGGILNDTQIQSIKLPASELKSYRFVDLLELQQFVTPRKKRRLEQAFQALENNQTLYLENQLPT
jgi:ADP-ribose pyrophosphatase YjhB (NUDIX family)